MSVSNDEGILIILISTLKKSLRLVAIWPLEKKNRTIEEDQILTMCNYHTSQGYYLGGPSQI